MQGFITDRTTIPGHHGDCYLVTGSIGPQFSPRLFAKKSDAILYGKQILRAGRDLWPAFNPVIEYRYQSDAAGLKLECDA